MTKPQPLTPQQLRRTCDPAQFAFETTADLEDLEEILGQERALNAIRFGIGMQKEGYNLFALGPSGTGKRTTILQFLERKASDQARPDDWCYVNNFEEPHKPQALKLPPGHGRSLRDDMKLLLEELQTAIPAAFESEDYRTQRQEIEEEFKEQQEAAFKEIQEQARAKDIGMIRTPAGLAFVPLKEDGEEREAISPEEFEKLPEERREQFETDIAALQERLQEIIHQVREWEKAAREKMQELDRQLAMFAVGHRIEEMRKRYAEFPAVIAYLDAVQEDIVENVQEFRKPQDGPQPVLGMPTPPYATDGSPFFRRYRVNLLVDHSESEGAPVDSEDHPTYVNLIGRIEHIAQMGALITDFNLIKPGALHRANGGYLLLDAREVLLQPYAWEGLKRVLRAGEIGIEPLGQALSLVSTVSLEPEPIPLDVKIILYGERRLYYLLHRLDPDFAELFKVEADFNDEMTRTEDSQLGYARMIGMIARQEELRPFNRGAVARLIEHSTRMVSDTEKLSTHLASLADLMREADYWAQVNENGAITASDIQHAIDAQIERADRLRERLQERINRGVIFIDSQGEVVGQVNGLSIIRLGHFTFGQPNRITARVRLGKGKFIDIEREVALGGPIHSKGVLILSSFLGARYAPEHPLSLSASLVFEQSYGGVEGDSASLAELCALLSALAQAPIKQSLAMTGSVNQRGQIQPIGGVNEKIEGFFDICQARGLTDEQGVIIPRANVQHLMLRQDVVEAVADGAFHIYAAETVDEAMALLTDRPAGQRGSDGQFPTASINHQVERRLIEMAEKQRDFQKKADKEKEEKE